MDYSIEVKPYVTDLTLGLILFLVLESVICDLIAFYRRYKSQLLLLTAPILITLLATYLHKYPFYERLILFFIFSAIAEIAEGIAFLLTRTKKHY